MRHRLLTAALLLALASLVSCRKPIPTAPDREAIATAVNAFHTALSRGDSASAMSLLAPDAQILESGHAQTREEYESEHLAADIEFAKAVPSKPGAMIIRQEGAVAWATSTSKSEGKFRGNDVAAENAELIVLVKQGDRWQMRAIHWSSHSHRSAQ